MSCRQTWSRGEKGHLPKPTPISGVTFQLPGVMLASWTLNTKTPTALEAGSSSSDQISPETRSLCTRHIRDNEAGQREWQTHFGLSDAACLSYAPFHCVFAKQVRKELWNIQYGRAHAPIY